MSCTNTSFLSFGYSWWLGYSSPLHPLFTCFHSTYELSFGCITRQIVANQCQEKFIRCWRCERLNTWRWSRPSIWHCMVKYWENLPKHDRICLHWQNILIMNRRILHDMFKTVITKNYTPFSLKYILFTIGFIFIH